MIAFAERLVDPAREAGIKVPDDPVNYNPQDFPYWHVYTTVQLGTPMPSPISHVENAKVVATVPESEIKTITLEQLIDRGLEIGHQIP